METQDTPQAEAPQTDAPQADAAQAETPQAEAPVRTVRKERVGTVVSAKMDKTITVLVERQKKHPMYQKYLRRSSRFMAHDEDNDANEGDTVRVMETRPLSKHKRWRLTEIIERAK